MVHRNFLTIFLAYLFLDVGNCKHLWPKGVVHYSINQKDYDVHSQDEITSTLDAIQKEICLKFFNTPMQANPDNKILYIHNPDKQKSCPPAEYNFNNSVVDMVVGYKCVNQREISRIVVEMLRSSILQTVSTFDSYDLMMKFKSDVSEDATRSGLLSPTDRNFINAHYHHECGSLDHRPPLPSHRRSGIRSEELQWYKDKLWPLGVVMYTVAPELRGTPDHSLLRYAMTAIELASCVVFQFHDDDGEAVLQPNHILAFGVEGDDVAMLGFKEGKQALNLKAFTNGVPGHSAHTINNLMRALGVPMMSNRHDRDNYVAINWKHVDSGKGHLLEKDPEGSWIQSVPYDFESVTHAPANFLCSHCLLGQRTVEPLLVFADV